jgi:LemA protein
VKSYNQAIKLFPKNVVANFSGFQKREYFEIQEKDKQVPTVTF